MKKLPIIIAFVLMYYLDTVLFDVLGIKLIAPNCLIALLVAMGSLLGGLTTGIIGIAVGLFVDIVCNHIIGLSSVFFGLAAAAGGFFYEKFYADNPIIPAVTASIMVFLIENITFIICIITGRNIGSYLMLLLTHILPSMLLTGILCAGDHFVLKKLNG